MASVFEALFSLRLSFNFHFRQLAFIFGFIRIAILAAVFIPGNAGFVGFGESLLFADAGASGPVPFFFIVEYAGVEFLARTCGAVYIVFECVMHFSATMRGHVPIVKGFIDAVAESGVSAVFADVTLFSGFPCGKQEILVALGQVEAPELNRRFLSQFLAG